MNISSHKVYFTELQCGIQRDLKYLTRRSSSHEESYRLAPGLANAFTGRNFQEVINSSR